MRELRDTILRLNAQANEVRSVLLLGETGVGKTYVADIIARHRCWLTAAFTKSDRKPWKAEEISSAKQVYVESRGAGLFRSSGEPFREVNIPTMEGPLAASQLFGHKQGAFTGADKDHTGFLGVESVTDILLDEIGYASLEMQRSLLQLLQSGQFYCLKSTTSELARARIFAATNQNLQRLVKEGKFQEDLWWRLTDHVLHIPPLRERQESIKPLAHRYVRELNQVHLRGDGSAHLRLSDADLKWATAYNWPGNVRELEKTVGRWFFYRASRSLQEVHQDVLKFVPQLLSGSAADSGIAIDEAAFRSHLMSLLSGAVAGGSAFKSLDKLVEVLLNPARTRCAEIVVECIDEQGWTSEEDLKRLFKGIKLSSARESLSRIRSRIASRSNKLHENAI